MSNARRMKSPPSPAGKHQGLSTSCAPRSASGSGARRRFFSESPGGGGRRPSSVRQNPAGSATLLRGRWMSANSMPPPQIRHRLRAHHKGTGPPRPVRGGRRAASAPAARRRSAAQGAPDRGSPNYANGGGGKSSSPSPGSGRSPAYSPRTGQLDLEAAAARSRGDPRRPYASGPGLPAAAASAA